MGAQLEAAQKEARLRAFATGEPGFSAPIMVGTNEADICHAADSVHARVAVFR
jgi:hypothetical protein